jgi:serine/threonine protein kinase
MQADRWQRIESLFHAALELAPEKRAAFLQETCGDDETLRADVERLTANDSAAQAFMQSRALEVAARKLAKDESGIRELTGKTILHYHISEKIGAGGMGEVYRAEDSRLHRRVAIKVLPDEFANDAERLARFQREAEVLASLNNPNIATLYSLEESGGRCFIVMELVEGQTLAQRLLKGPLPVKEVLQVCRQLAEGLEAAHESGVIHRDLKPANVKISSDGNVKILDFGLAKAFHPEAAQGAAEELSIIIEATTGAGMILGTAAYMSPEQAKGKTVDKRADIWAFGCILYECLTGNKTFSGDSITEVVAKILEAEPDWGRLPPQTPLFLRKLLHRCLRKDPKLRLHDIADARIEITESATYPSEAVSAPRRSSRIAATSVLIVIALFLAWWVGMRIRQPGRDNAVTSRTEIDLAGNPGVAIEGEASFLGNEGPLITISPDGSRIVYVGTAEDGVARLYMREMDGFEVEPIAGTEGAIHPFFSPDGQSIGFLTNDKVKIVPATGGSPRTLCAAASPVLASWTSADEIFFTERETSILAHVHVRSGNRVIGESAPQDEYRFRQVLPDGSSVLTTFLAGGRSYEYAEIRLLDAETKKTRILVPNGYGASYVEPGYLLFGRAGDLYAVRFDPARLQIQGKPRRIASDVRMNSLFGHVQAAASGNGILVYLPGGDAARGKLAWVDRQNRVEFLPMEERVYGALDLSPDGLRVAVGVHGVNDYIEVYDLERGDRQTLREPDGQRCPAWSPDGGAIAYTRISPEGKCQMVVRRLQSDQPPAVLHESDDRVYSYWSSDGRQLVAGGLYKSFTVTQVSPGGKLSEKRVKSIQGVFLDIAPTGKWAVTVDYEKNGEIRVYSLESDRSYQIVPEHGAEPRWCTKCDELFYRNGNRWYSARAVFGSEFKWDKPRLVFQTRFVDTPGLSYDISPDGQRLLVVKPTREFRRDRIHVIHNWTSLLEDEQ